nr:RNA-directed DNA polymerase, eukaryota [Tanacetum cinerariifolium]
ECQLDQQWFDLTKDTLRDALQITPVNNNKAFSSPPSSDALINFVNELGYLKLVRNLSNVRKHKFHPRPDSPLHLPNEEPILGYLKFSAKGTKREVFRIPILGNLITADRKKSNLSYGDHTQRISHSIFVTNFPDNITSRDLWKACNLYGTMVDVFIPRKKSQAGRGGMGYRKSNDSSHSYANAINGASPVVNPGSLILASPALVLDKNCIVKKDFSKHAMGRVIDASSIPNLQVILYDEGFTDVKLKYLGGLWVLIEFEKEEIKKNLMAHLGVNSWFQTIQEVPLDFVSNERIAWTLNIEDQFVPFYSRKRVCILTKSPVSILESFKIIVKGKVFMVRAKELFTWYPSFSVNKENVSSSDDESVHGERPNDNLSVASEEEEGEFINSNIEGVAETVFGDNYISPERLNGVSSKSEDPFHIYDILNKKKSNEIPHRSCPSLSHPPGFTPDNLVSEKGSNDSRRNIAGSKGGSVLEVLEEVIKMNILSINVQGLGNKTKKEWIKELSSKSNLNFLAIQETKLEKISQMDVKFMWGDSNFDFVYSESLGFSAGILCIWEKDFFKKYFVTVSDNFIAVYETWIPSNTKFLSISIYAPQQTSLKKELWDYLLVLLGRWNGEVVLMGDFNDVRSKDERRGSSFSSSGARFFNQFISPSGLSDIKLEGASFTLSHPSATKMSKLDRFLISEGVVSLFPSILGSCLDRHLSDHRPILLHDVHVDFGPTPFRFYHSWFNYDGFDNMVDQTWRSFSHSDRNGMIRFKKKLQDLKSSIRNWIKVKRLDLNSSKKTILDELSVIDKELDREHVIEPRLARRQDLTCQLYNIRSIEAVDRRSQLSIRGIFVDGLWQTDPTAIKEAFLDHFTTRFSKPMGVGPKIIFSFPKRLSSDQVSDLESNISRDEIRKRSNTSSLIECFLTVVTLLLLRLFRRPLVLVRNDVNGFKQGDPLAPLLFILVMESLHLSFNRVVDAGVGVHTSDVSLAAASIRCSIMKNQFRYLGVMVGENMSRHKAWSNVTLKLRSHLSKWKTKTLSVGGRLTLLKSILGVGPSKKKITWVAWNQVLASKEKGGLGVSSFYALNRALLLKWVWSSNWCSILREMNSLKDISVASKMAMQMDSSFRRPARGGIELSQLNDLISFADMVSLSSVPDRWFCNVAGNGNFSVNIIRNLIDDLILPSSVESTRWVKSVPIKINIFMWRARRDCLPTRLNLSHRGVVMETVNCPTCGNCEEDVQHVFFRCDLARDVLRGLCRWWELDWDIWSSFSSWNSWFASISLGSNLKSILEGVFCVAWWSIWTFRNRLLYDDKPPLRSAIMEDIKSISFLWCKNRCKWSFSWDEWLKNPHLITL